MILSYFTSAGWPDVFILLLGVFVAAVAIYGTKTLSRSHAFSKREQEEAKRRWSVAQRWMTVFTDLFPLFGLLGTTLAILHTFLSLNGPIDPSSVMSNFAPGLTTTVSGIFCAVVNTILLQLEFNPAFEKRFEL